MFPEWPPDALRQDLSKCETVSAQARQHILHRNHYKTGNDVKNDVANCVLAGLVETMLYELSSEIIPDEFTYKIGDGIIKKGVARTLNEDLNIKFGK